MANFFETSFGVNFADWDCLISDPVEKPDVGCDGGYMYGCSQSALVKTFAEPDTPLTEITFRAQVARIGFDATQLNFFELDNFLWTCPTTTAAGTAFNLVGYWNSDDSVTITISKGDGSNQTFTTAPGALPSTAAPQAIQLTLSFPTNKHVDFEFVINNVSVLTGSVDAVIVFGDQAWGHLEGYVPLAPYINVGGVSNLAINSWYTVGGGFNRQIAFFNVQLENAVNITDYPPCTAYGYTCCQIPPTTTGMTYDCNTRRITITGTGFKPNVEVIIIGPEDAPPPDLTFTTISSTETEIVLEVSEPGFLNLERYCANVDNPCDPT